MPISSESMGLLNSPASKLLWPLGEGLCLCGFLYMTTIHPDIYTAYSFLSSRFLFQHQILKAAYFNDSIANYNSSTYTWNSSHSELPFLWYLSSDIKCNLFIYHAHILFPVFLHSLTYKLAVALYLLFSYRYPQKFEGCLSHYKHPINVE